MGLALEAVKRDLLATKPTFEQMNLNKLSFSQEMEFAVQAFTGNPKLLDCSPDSVRNCLVNIVLSGLTLNPVMKFAHLVPRKGKCCLDPSYMGLVKIITDTGSVQSIKARIVYKNEPFDIELGSNGFVKHSICKTGPKGPRIGAYSEAVLNDGSLHIEWMYEEQLMDIKKRALASGGAVWKTDEDEMCKKTVVKRHWKLLPKSERALLAAQAIALDDENNGIDFDKEQKQKGSDSPEAATPGLDDYEEMANDSIVSTLLEKLDHEALANVEIFHYIQMSAKKMKGGITKAHDAGTLTAEKAQQYNEFLDAEIKWATKNPPTETAEGVDGEQPAEETQEKGE